MGKKCFVLRTESLVSKEGAKTLFSFGSDNEIVIPFPVIDKLEALTHQYTQQGKNAKAILEYISTFSIKELMSKEGVMQKKGSRLRLVSGYDDVEIPFTDLSKFDERCLQIAKGIKNDNPKMPVILISKNPALILKANSLGIKCQNYRDDIFPTLEEQYKGRIACTTSSENLAMFFENGKMQVKQIHNYSNIEFMPNMFLIITCPNDPQQSAIARFNGNEIVKLHYENYHPYKMVTQNSGQLMLQEALMESADNAPLVIAMGGAGTGKTYVSLASALDQTFGTNKKYSQILITTPVETVGQERIGFLPGDMEEKLNPHLGGIRDNLRIILEKYDPKKNVNSMFNDPKIQIQPIGFLRGRTIVDTYFIIDETQNIAPDDIKSIVTRAGKGSKFVFLGDPTQIDNPRLNERYNGLVYLSEKMKENPLAWQVALQDNESVRSELARIASKIL